MDDTPSPALIEAEYGTVVSLIQDMEAQSASAQADISALKEAYAELEGLEELAVENGIYLQIPPWRLHQLKTQ